MCTGIPKPDMLAEQTLANKCHAIGTSVEQTSLLCLDPVNPCIQLYTHAVHKQKNTCYNTVHASSIRIATDVLPAYITNSTPSIEYYLIDRSVVSEPFILCHAAQKTTHHHARNVCRTTVLGYSRQLASTNPTQRILKTCIYLR